MTKKLNILLIQPYITIADQNVFLTEPLGLSYLGNYIKDSHNIKILDLFALGFNNYIKKGNCNRIGLSNSAKIVDLVSKYNPDVVGINCNFLSYQNDSLEIAKLVKGNFRESVVILGGPQATLDAEEILKNNNFVDIIVRSEGELTFKELLDNLANKKNIKDTPGITYRTKSGMIRSNLDRALIPDLAILPINDRSNLNMKHYLKNNTNVLAWTKQKPVVSIMTSRGCPYRCIFCSTTKMWKQRWRPIPAQKVVEEIEILVKKYGAKEIVIYDDQFMADKNRVNNICDLLIKKRLGITLSIPPGTSIWLADKELLKKMKKAGFYRLGFPIETGDINTMKFIGKPIDLVKAKQNIDIANRLGFWTQGYFIIGFPYETKEQIKRTIKYAFESGLDYAIFYVAQPYKGTELYDIFQKEGLLAKKKETGMGVLSAKYDTLTMRAEEIQKIRDNANKRYFCHRIKFYANPFNFYKYFLPKISNFADFRYALKLFYVTFVIEIIQRFFLKK